jgi:hypothetical protein
LYYVPAAIIYRLFYNSDLFTKVFFVRLYSVFLLLLNIFIIYRMGRLFFRNNLLFVISFPLLVIFMPMFIFANTGVNSDALGNLFFTAYLYLTLLIFKNGLNLKKILLLLSIVFLCIYAKPQFIITFPLSFLSVLIIFLRDTKGIRKKISYSMISLIIFGCLYIVSIRNHGLLGLLPGNGSEFNIGSFFKFFMEYTIPHTWKEVLPWYWGIYDWLGVTYPRLVHKIINRVVIISMLGMMYKSVRFILSRKKPDRIQQGIIFLIIIQAVYFTGISYYDWLSWYKSGYQLGVQGRYFFPLISLQMYLLLTGWVSLIPNRWGLKEKGVKLLVILMIILNFVALYTVVNTYYNSHNFQFLIFNFQSIFNYIKLLINNISQYKPWFLKGNILIVLGFSYLTAVGVLMYKYLRVRDNG